jgi:C-terminal processing protease CtpA/Prc
VLSGDTIISIDSEPVTNLTFGAILKQKIDTEFPLTYSREGEPITTQVRCPDDQCFFGIRYE